MKRLILLLILFVPLQLSAELQIPSLKAPVMDAAGALNPAEEQEVNSVLRWLESTGKVQMAVYFPKSLQGYDIESFSIEVAEKWKLGQRGVDNGLLMIVAMNERKARLEVGYGLEGDIPDAYAKRILDDVLIPFLREGNLKDGVIASIAQVTVYLDIPLPEDGAVRVQVPEPQGGGGGGLFDIIFFLIIIFLVLFSRVFRWFFIGSTLFGGGRWGGGSSGGFGGGGFGGFSGGGGGFGGGGASSGW